MLTGAHATRFERVCFFVRGNPKFSTEPGLARPIRRNIGRAGLIKILFVGRLSRPALENAARCKNRNVKRFPCRWYISEQSD